MCPYLLRQEGGLEPHIQIRTSSQVMNSFDKKKKKITEGFEKKCTNDNLEVSCWLVLRRTGKQPFRLGHAGLHTAGTHALSKDPHPPQGAGLRKPCAARSQAFVRTAFPRSGSQSSRPPSGQPCPPPGHKAFLSAFTWSGRRFKHWKPWTLSPQLSLGAREGL